MKSNLDQFFKTSTEFETKGVWFDLSEEIGFLLKRFGGWNAPAVKQAMAKHYKPFAKQVETGTLPIAKEREIMVKIFVESVLVDWKGVEIDGVKTPFSKEAAEKLFTQLPDLFDTLSTHASSHASYKEELGNS